MAPPPLLLPSSPPPHPQVSFSPLSPLSPFLPRWRKKEGSGRRSWNGIRKLLCARKFPKVFFPYIEQYKLQNKSFKSCFLSFLARICSPPPFPPSTVGPKEKEIRMYSRVEIPGHVPIFPAKKGVLIFNSSHAPRFPFLAMLEKRTLACFFSHACTRRKKNRLTPFSFTLPLFFPGII